MDQQHPIYDLSSRIVDDLAALQPVTATFLGIAGHDHRWDDASPAGIDHIADYARGALYEIEALPPARDKWETLAIEVAKTLLNTEIDHIDAGDHFLEFDSLASRAQDYRQVFDHMGKDTTQHWHNIAARLEGIDGAFMRYRALLDEGRTRRRVVAKRQVHAVVEQCRTTAGEESYFSTLRQEFIDSGINDRPLEERIAAGVAHAKAAFDSFGDYLETTYLPDAVERDAVGRDRYLRAAHRFLGTDIDPEATYAWGWSEVERLRTAMAEVAEEIKPGATVAEVIELLTTDPERAAADRAEFVSFIEGRLETALTELADTHFDVPEEIRSVTVQLAPPGGPLGAYYVGPSEDWTRPGSVWWSLKGDGPFSLFDEVSTAYHEGFPGHHLQVGIQMSMSEHLTRLHRMLVWYPGLGEGWALYSEKLMHELGYFEKPDYVFGWLASQMLRACRVVIDVGSHLGYPIPSDQPFHPGEEWSFETGVEMLVDYATLERAYAESEMTRYLGWPAQAISYKLGERVILELRDELMKRPDFDLKKFHADLLEVGPVGLDLLRSVMLGE